jgi:hypothetical protein
MRAAGWLRTDGFRLTEGFAGTFDVKDVKETKTRDSNVENNFRVVVGNDTVKSISIPGSIIANARLLPKAEIEGTHVAGAENVFMRDEIADVLNQSQIWHEAKGVADEDFEFPEKITIVGAMVDEDPDVEGSPRFPLRSFKHYNAVLKHHRELMGDETAFLTRDEFKEYITLTGDDRPAGVPESYTALELNESIKPGEMRNWQFTLLLADAS